MNMKVLGYEQVSFSFNDGHTVDGLYLYLHDEQAKKVTGMKTERVFLSNAKAQACCFTPKLNSNVRVLYNKYGKVDEVHTIS